MDLVKYKIKRNFKLSPEPTGGKSNSNQLRFVIQKHDASHLHYDFRLEMGGVLKSWAVPKGPSTDPDIKRLAMMVEDHPFDYRNFEGIIPSGYGAGTVIVWDEGFYEAAELVSTDKKEQDKNLRQQLQNGKLKINLHGNKLKGAYALVKSHGREENAWLLFKIKDEYASSKDITLKDKSVLSKKTLAQVEKTTQNFYVSERVKDSAAKKQQTNTKVLSKKNTVWKTAQTKSAGNEIKNTGKKKALVANQHNIETMLQQAPTKKSPGKITPMLATLVNEPFDEEGWQYEIKWDGYRAISFLNKGNVEIKSRNQQSFTEKFYPVTEALKNWKLNAVLDGEIVVVNKKGISDFGALQNWRSEADGELHYYVFDLLWLNGKNISALPLTERQLILAALIKADSIVKLSESFTEKGTVFFETAKQMGLEGIIAKRTNSIYKAGTRSKDWLKIKASKRQEMVIGGYTKNDNSSKLFSALLAGVYQNGQLIYTGKIGTGFDATTQREMMKEFKPLIIKKPAFNELPDINKPSRFRPNPPHASATWLKPILVCEVNFTEMTADGVMRHPSFAGMRIDKKAKNVLMEKAKPVRKAVKAAAKKNNPIIKPSAGNNERKTLLNPSDETQTKKTNGHELKFTNLSKLYWPKEKITKRDMINYYYQVAPYILPYLKNRPQSMNRHPDGINGESFYFKDVTGKAPDWIEKFLYKSDADNRERHYLVAKDEASLLYMASLGCIEMNPWSSTVKKEDYPDWCIIDLDPSAKNTFDQVIETALVTKNILDEMKIDSYPKTSGSSGMHIYIPLGAKYTYDQSKEFARVIAKLIVEQLPGFTSIERIVNKRRGKMYIDFLQNRSQATIAAPYSIRPKPGATVSMPLYWDEVKKGLKISDFTIFNTMDRIRAVGDIFKPVLGKGINMARVIQQFEEK